MVLCELGGAWLYLCFLLATTRTAGTVGLCVQGLPVTLCPLREEEVAPGLGTRQELISSRWGKVDSWRRQTNVEREKIKIDRYPMVLQHILPFTCLGLWRSVPLVFSSRFRDLPAWFYLWLSGLAHPSSETSVWLGLPLSGFSWASPLL